MTAVLNESAMEVLHIYTRVSTVAQADHGTSLESQLTLGMKRAAELGFRVQHWDEGGKSSFHEDIAGRPKLNSLFLAIKAGQVKHLWVYDQSRLSRNDQVASIFRYQCNKQGVTLYTKDGQFDLSSPTDMLMKQLLDALAEFDNVTRTERTRLGKILRVRSGSWHGGAAPFGYKLEGKKLVVATEESRWVKRIFKQALEGTTSPEIKKMLDSNGVSARRGGLWTLGSVQAMLKNPHYAGSYTFTDSKTSEKISVQCPQIVDELTWKSVQLQRSKLDAIRQAQKNRTVANFYLLRDFMFCAHCGRPISGRIKALKNEALYYCPNKERAWAVNGGTKEPWKRGTGCGFDRSMNIPQTDKLVWELLRSVHGKSSTLKEVVKQRVLQESGLKNFGDADHLKQAEARIKKSQKELATISEILGNLEANRLMKKVDELSYKTTVRRIQEEKDRLEFSITEARLQIRGGSEKRKWTSWLEAFGSELKPDNQLSDEEKKMFIDGLVDRIDVKYLPDSREHELRLRFRLPIVNDAIKWVDPKNKRKGYNIVDGELETTLAAKKKDGRG